MAENKTRGATKALVTTREPTLSASRGARRPVCGPIDRKEARERLASNDEPATSAPLRNAKWGRSIYWPTNAMCWS